jgi:peptidoglycan hydrolase CwlO-like protein
MGHIDNFKKFRNREEKSLTEQEGEANIMSVPDKFKSEQEAINQKRNDIANREQAIANEKVQLNKMINELQNKISAENAAIANAANATASTSPAPQTTPSV